MGAGDAGERNVLRPRRRDLDAVDVVRRAREGRVGLASLQGLEQRHGRQEGVAPFDGDPGVDDCDNRRGRRRWLEPREDALDPRCFPRLRLIDAQQPIQGRGGREDADARHPAPVIAAAPEQRHGALLSISMPEVPLVRPARDAQPRQRVRE